MSDQNPKELIGQVKDDDLRKQLEATFEALSGSTLRKQVEDLSEQVKTYRQKDRTRAFRDAGFDPESGPGKALAKLYDGDADPEAIQQFAKDEFGFEPQSGSTSTQTQQTQRQPSGDAAISSLSAGTIAPREPSNDDQIAEAEKNGDWEAYDRLQAAKLLRQ